MEYCVTSCSNQSSGITRLTRDPEMWTNSISVKGAFFIKWLSRQWLWYRQKILEPLEPIDRYTNSFLISPTFVREITPFLFYGTFIYCNIILDLFLFLGFIDDGNGTVTNSRSITRYLSLFSLCIIIFSQIQILRFIRIYYFVSICIYNILCFR